MFCVHSMYLAVYFFLAETEGSLHLWHYLNIWVVGFLLLLFFSSFILVATEDLKSQAATKDSRLQNEKGLVSSFPLHVHGHRHVAFHISWTPKQGYSTFFSVVPDLQKAADGVKKHSCFWWSSFFSSG